MSIQDENKKLSTLLLDWYYAERRILPWREDPTPYHVWLSEIMLQQTRVEAVKEYYRRFLEVLPDVRALAEAQGHVLQGYVTILLMFGDIDHHAKRIPALGGYFHGISVAPFLYRIFMIC